MPAERLPMRQVREVLRLKHAGGLSERQIAAVLRISRSTVADYLRRAAVAGFDRNRRPTSSESAHATPLADDFDARPCLAICGCHSGSHTLASHHSTPSCG